MTAPKPPQNRRSYQRHGLYALQGALQAVAERDGWLESLGEVGTALQAWRAGIIADLGGEEAISAQQRAIIELATRTYLLLLESVDRWLLQQPSLVNKSRRQLFPVVLQRQQLADALARYMSALGLDPRRRRKDIARTTTPSEPLKETTADEQGQFSPRGLARYPTARYQIAPADRPPARKKTIAWGKESRAEWARPLGRCDPQEFLRRAKEEEARRSRGRLKVFFGAAAGVGKTYAMLEAARQQRQAGVDVVIGVMETHKRPETEELLMGFDTLPPCLVEYHGVVLTEFDLDAALARQPTLVLVDELAHTNVPGGRHAKRWQDVEELLAAGINVYTTVNVQHLESVNDVVGKITGVTVRETIPDFVFARADEIELIDLSPEDLRRRLEAGKVYIPERAGMAVRNFFREGNLIALRQLALRCAADHVDAQMQRYRRDRAVAPTWPVAERIMVCIGPDPLVARLVRAGRRRAMRLGAQWVVAYVETPAHARLSQEARARVAATLQFAERLGAETATLTGPSVSDEILAYARSRNVSQILIGKPARSLWKRILVGSDVDALVRGSGDIDISVISGERERDEIELPHIRAHSPGAAYGLAVLAVLVSMSVGYLMFPHFELSNIVMTYLLGVVAVAHTGRGPAVLAALLSVAAIDFFFVPPYYSLEVADTQYLVTLAVMLIVALVIGDLTVRATRQAETARTRERRTAALYALNRELADMHSVTELLEVGIRHLIDVLGGQIAILLPDDQGHLQTRASLMATSQLEPNDIAVAQWAYEHGQPAGAGTDNLPRGQMLFVPLRASRAAVGALGIRPSHPGALDDAESRGVLGTFANQIALAVERNLLAEEAQRAQLHKEAEELRTSLLSSVSHELRAPLASITSAARTLATGGDTLEAPVRKELAESIREDADRLHRLVSNLLDMTRLESGATRLHREWQSLEGVVGAALRHMGLGHRGGAQIRGGQRRLSGAEPLRQLAEIRDDDVVGRIRNRVRGTGRAPFGGTRHEGASITRLTRRH